MKKIFISIVFIFLFWTAQAQVNMLRWDSLRIKGIQSYQEDKFDQALTLFEEAEKLFPTDTFALVMGAECAFFLENYELAEKKLENAINFQRLIKNPRWYNYYLYILKNVKKDYTLALQTVWDIRSKFGKNDSIAKSLEISELEIYLLSNQAEKAKELLSNLLAKNPQSADLNYNMGLLFEKQKDFAQAHLYYQKTLQINPRYFAAYYNLGTYYYNLAVEGLAKIAELNAEEQLAEIQSIGNQIIINFQEAKKYYEPAHQLELTDLDIIHSLNTIDTHLESLNNQQALIVEALSAENQKTEEVKQAENARKLEDSKKSDEYAKKQTLNILQTQEQAHKSEELKKQEELKLAENQRIEAEKLAKKIKAEAEKTEALHKIEELRQKELLLAQEKQKLIEEAHKLAELKLSAQTQAKLAEEEALKAESLRKQAEANARVQAEAHGNKILIAIHDLRFEYAHTSDSSLHKGETGYIKFKVENYGSAEVQNLKITLSQPIRNPDLQYEPESVIQSINAQHTQELSISIKYLENNALTRGVREVEGAPNKMRLFVKSNNGQTLDLLEFSFHLGNQKNEQFEDLNTSNIHKIPQNYLLIIGTDKYKYWKPLKNAVKDAQDVKNVLIERYRFDKDHCYELYDEQVTRANIVNVLTKLRSEISEIDNLVLYYSGHGFYSSEFETGYWIPYDAPEKAEYEYLKTEDIIRYVSFINSRHTFLIADACFSGSLFLGESRGNYFENVESKKSRWALTSGGLEYVSDGAGKNSPFAKYLLDFLKTNQESRFAVSKLTQYVIEKVALDSDQHPQAYPLKRMGHTQGGEIVFYLKNK